MKRMLAKKKDIIDHLEAQLPHGTFLWDDERVTWIHSAKKAKARASFLITLTQSAHNNTMPAE